MRLLLCAYLEALCENLTVGANCRVTFALNGISDTSPDIMEILLNVPLAQDIIAESSGVHANVG